MKKRNAHQSEQKKKGEKKEVFFVTVSVCVGGKWKQVVAGTKSTERGDGEMKEDDADATEKM